MRSLLFLFVASFAAPLFAEPATLPGAAQDGEDPPAILERQSQDERELDKLTAASMFAHGRLLYQREKYDAALRRYQRAYRYDPEAVVILDEIVALAFEIDHNEEAARYAVLAAEKNPKDPLLLRRLAMHLAEEQDYERALKLYKKSFELQKDVDSVTSVLLHMEIGRLHFLQEEYAPAAESFGHVRDAIANPKKFGLSDELYKIVVGNAHGTYTLLGESFLQAGKYDDAEAMFKKADETKPDEATLAYHTARVRAKQEKVDEALAQLEIYYKAEGEAAGVDAYELLGELLAKKHADKDEAATKFRERLKDLHAADADNVALAYAYGRELKNAGEHAAAIATLQKSLQEEVTAEAATLLVELLRSQKKYDELLTVLGQAVGKSGTLDSLGGEAEALAADADAMGRLLTAARARNVIEPQKLKYGEALAVALLAIKVKELDAAEAFFLFVIENPPADKTAIPPPEAVITWGLDLLQADEYARAAKVFQLALDKKLAPQREDLLYYFLSSALEMDGKTDEALATIEKALTGKKPAARMLGRKAWILYHAKRHAAAERAYLDLLAMWDADHKTNGNRDAMREARMVLSNITVQTNRRAEAMEWLEQVLDEFPEDIGAMNDLGYLWAEDGMHLRRALGMLEKAVAAEPENHAYRDSLGWVYYQLQRYPEAVVELEKATAGDEPDGVVLDHLGDAYHKSGDLAKARATWERAAAALEKEKDEAKLKATREKLEKHK